MRYPDLLASQNEPFGFVPFDLYAGESDIVTSQGIVADASDLQQFQVISRDGDMKLVGWDGVTGKPVGFTAQPGSAGGMCPFFSGGMFDQYAMLWPPGVDTFEQRKAAFDGTNIGVATPIPDPPPPP